LATTGGVRLAATSGTAIEGFEMPIASKMAVFKCTVSTSTKGPDEPDEALAAPDDLDLPAKPGEPEKLAKLYGLKVPVDPNEPEACRAVEPNEPDKPEGPDVLTDPCQNGR
jgi:hypothetical protein